VSSSGHDIDEFPDGDPGSEVYDRFSADVVARGRAVFELLTDG